LDEGCGGTSVARAWATMGQAGGIGLSVVLEMVEDEKSKKPAPELAKRIVHECFQPGLALVAAIGLYGGAIHIAPPLVITENEAMTGVGIIEDALKAASSS